MRRLVPDRPATSLARLLAMRSATASTMVAVQLVLAVDVSGSVSQDRFELQREGYAAAFRSPEVLQAIRPTATGSIAVAVLQWTGPTLHVVAVDWTLIDDAASAENFATAIVHAPRVLVRWRHIDQRRDRLCPLNAGPGALPWPEAN